MNMYELCRLYVSHIYAVTTSAGITQSIVVWHRRCKCWDLDLKVACQCMAGQVHVCIYDLACVFINTADLTSITVCHFVIRIPPADHTTLFSVAGARYGTRLPPAGRPLFFYHTRRCTAPRRCWIMTQGLEDRKWRHEIHLESNGCVPVRRREPAHRANYGNEVAQNATAETLAYGERQMLHSVVCT
jgi:hypothetical protein